MVHIRGVVIKKTGLTQVANIRKKGEMTNRILIVVALQMRGKPRKVPVEAFGFLANEIEKHVQEGLYVKLDIVLNGIQQPDGSYTASIFAGAVTINGIVYVGNPQGLTKTEEQYKNERHARNDGYRENHKKYQEGKGNSNPRNNNRHGTGSGSKQTYNTSNNDQSDKINDLEKQIFPDNEGK